MPWIVGIDEAGYGPNLGPFVMTAIGCQVPQKLADADLWDVLKGAVRRHAEPLDGRVVVADSKAVYSPTRGLAALEETVHAILPSKAGQTVADFVELVSPACHKLVRREIWYHGTTAVPAQACALACSNAWQIVADLSKSLDVCWRCITSVVVCPAAFNAIIDKWGTKGAVLGSSLVRLLRGLPADDEPVSVFIDKHGGRNNYCAVLQPAFEDGLVIARDEGPERSTYQVAGSRRQIEMTFQPRADASHFCVALASMFSKYLRELLMLEFNQYWQQKMPTLKATAGYPGDASRFWQEIQGLVRELGIAEDALWRRK